MAFIPAAVSLIVSKPLGTQSILQRIVASEVKRDTVDERLSQLASQFPDGTISKVEKFIKAYDTTKIGSP